MARRAHGDGTIYYDGKRDRWIGAVKVGGRRRKVSGKDKTEARTKLRELIAARETNTPIGDGKMTVGTLLDTFMEREVQNPSAKSKPRAPSTVEVYCWAVRIITAEIGSVLLADLDVVTVEKMLDRLAGRKSSPLGVASLRKIRSTLTRALEFGIRRGSVQRNVARHAAITASAAPGTTRTALSPDDARTLLAALHDERNGAMFALQLRAGLRPGEATGMFWEDFGKTAVNVTRAVQMVAGRARISDDLKTDSAKRTIELPADMVAMLTAHRKAQAAERLKAESWGDDRLMFATPTGNVVDPSNARRHLAGICDRAGVPTVRPNELRHSCASLLADMGVRNEQIADLLGHTTTRMVEQVYRHRLRPVVDVAARFDPMEGRA